MREDSLTMFAYAKINLALAITGWQDGFHQLETVMQSIETHDVIEIRRKGTAIHCECGELSGPGNLAFKAAEIFLRNLGKPEGVDIKIKKNIPLQAGLAGGSSDAAAVLRALNRLFANPFSTEELEEIALRCGSDVPFCLSGGTKWATGRGDKLAELPEAASLNLVLVKPSRGVDTAEAYRRFAANPVYRHLEREHWVSALKSGDPERIAQLLSNDLEGASLQLVPEIAAAKEKLGELGCPGALMSGSGSAVFGIVRDAEEAEFIAGLMRTQGFDSWATRSVGSEEIGKG